MADLNVPLNPVQQFDPSQQMGMLSQALSIQRGRVGLQQQQQDLQTGAIGQQKAQADLTMAQQKTANLQGMQGALKNGIASGELLDPETKKLDTNKAYDVLMKIGGVDAPEYAKQFVGSATEMVANKKALLDLGGDQQKQLSGYMGAVAAKPGATRQDVLDAITAARGISKDPDYQRMIDSNLMGFPNTEGMPPQQASTTLRQHARMLAVGAGSASASQSDPNVGQLQQGSGVTPVNTNPQSPLGTGPVGAPIKNAIAPTIVTPPGGNPQVLGPGGSGISQGQYPGPKPTDQDFSNFSDYQKGLNQRVQLGSDAQARIHQTEAALSAIKSGAGSSTRASIAKSLQGLGAPQALTDAIAGGDLGKTQEAEKFLFQTTMQGLRQTMQGDPARVAEFNEANKVFPNLDTDPRAKQKIMSFISDQAERDYSEQQALNKSRKEGSFNPATWQGDYQKNLRAGKVEGTPASQIPKGETAQAEERAKSKSGKPIVKRDGKWVYE